MITLALTSSALEVLASHRRVDEEEFEGGRVMRTLALLTGIFGVIVPVLAAQSSSSGAEPPFMCNLRALSASERAEHQQLTARLADAVMKTREVADGYTFELNSTGFSFVDLGRWTDFERRCCPFFDFTLDWRRENGPMTLRLTGREGVKEFIRAEFPKNFR
jgi:hypothetical protein